MLSSLIIMILSTPILAILFLLSCLFCYFLPSYIARKNSHEHTPEILMTNLLFGWLILPWIAALAWAVLPQKQSKISYEERQKLRKCPFCYELVKKEAIKCKHCTAELLAEVEYPES